MSGVRNGDVIFKFENTVMSTKPKEWRQQIAKTIIDCKNIQQSHITMVVKRKEK